jgi:hypothetical protein
MSADTSVEFATVFQASRPERVRSLASGHLDWLYNQCESAMGVKSSHEASVAQIQGGGASPNDHERIATHPRVLAAAKKNRAILDTLSRLSVAESQVLERFYRREQSYPRDLEFNFGEHSGVVWWMRFAGKPDSKRKWTAEQVASVLTEAVQALASAHAAYDLADKERRAKKCLESFQDF